VAQKCVEAAGFLERELRRGGTRESGHPRGSPAEQRCSIVRYRAIYTVSDLTRVIKTANGQRRIIREVES
jgi:hypothetical protein